MLLVIAIVAILGSVAGFLAFLPYGWGIGLLAAPAVGAIAGLLVSVLIARAKLKALPGHNPFDVSGSDPVKPVE
jgi:ribose/xylose/arabinose/galactoside ABC-type transport system permease subunit